MSKQTQYWAVIPAAGVGRRMGSDIPKQYLRLQQRMVIEHSIERLLAVEAVCGAIVALDHDDQYWSRVRIQSAKPVLTTAGGRERCDSVLNALLALEAHVSQADAPADTWVLVHDAARPCVRHDDIERLIAEGSQQDDGGLLALPVRDTMKRASSTDQVDTTVDRSDLWHALTPQMFRLPLLINALQRAINDQPVTDDASAMELMGYAPRLVEGREDNIKITRPFDLELAAMYLQHLQETHQ